MCTVSFVISSGKIIITSNRDEQVLRPALEPKQYSINGKNLIFPKDPRAGGTWFAVDENSNVLVLLNGAAEKHEMKSSYRRSRGLIVLDIISSDSPLQHWKNIDLLEVEPFTLVLFEQSNLYQLRWNGIEKDSVVLDAEQNYIWSSSTLYSEDIRKNRSQWFRKFLETKDGISETEMFSFHRYTEDANSENGLVIDRNGELKTLSITQSVIEKNQVNLVHYDLIGQTESVVNFPIVLSGTI